MTGLTERLRSGAAVRGMGGSFCSARSGYARVILLLQLPTRLP